MHEHEDLGKRGVWMDQHDNVWGVVHRASVFFILCVVPAVESKSPTVLWPGLYAMTIYPPCFFSMYYYKG